MYKLVQRSQIIYEKVFNIKILAKVCKMYYTNKDEFFDIFDYEVYNFCKVHNICFMLLQIDDCKDGLHVDLLISYKS